MPTTPCKELDWHFSCYGEEGVGTFWFILARNSTIWQEFIHFGKTRLVLARKFFDFFLARLFLATHFSSWQGLIGYLRYCNNDHKSGFNEKLLKIYNVINIETKEIWDSTKDFFRLLKFFNEGKFLNFFQKIYCQCKKFMLNWIFRFEHLKIFEPKFLAVFVSLAYQT